MLDFLTQDDAASALQRTIHSEEQGVLIYTGADTLPLYDAVAKWGRMAVTCTLLVRFTSLSESEDFWEEVIFDME